MTTQIAPSDRVWTRPFFGVSLSTFVSGLGDGAVFVGLPLLAASLTRSALLVALVVVAQRLPWLFSLLTGAVTDRMPLRLFVGGLETARMVVVAALGLAVLGHFHPLMAVFAVSVCLGLLESSFFAATGRMMIDSVAPAQLGRANGYRYAAQMTSSVIGQAAGGLLAGVALFLPFLMDGASFGLSALALVVLTLGVLPPGGTVQRNASDGPGETLWQSMTAGWQWFLGHPAISLSSAYVAVLALCQSMVLSVLVVWALRFIHLSRGGYGLLEAVTTLGTVGGALVGGRLMDRIGGGPLLVGTALLSAGAYVVAGAVRAAVVAGAALFVEQAAVGAGSVASGALRQLLIPREMIGRVANLSRSLIYGAVPVGALGGGLLSAELGPRWPFLVGAAVQLMAVLLAGPRLIRLLAGSPTIPPGPPS